MSIVTICRDSFVFSRQRCYRALLLRSQSQVINGTCTIYCHRRFHCPCSVVQDVNVKVRIPRSVGHVRALLAVCVLTRRVSDRYPADAGRRCIVISAHATDLASGIISTGCQARYRLCMGLLQSASHLKFHLRDSSSHHVVEEIVCTNASHKESDLRWTIFSKHHVTYSKDDLKRC